MTMGPMMGWFWLLTWILFLAAVVVGLVYLIRVLNDRQRPETSSALRILEERFARGEIDRNEFEERKKTLLS